MQLTSCHPGCHDWREYYVKGERYRRCLRALCNRWDRFLGHCWKAIQ